MPANQLQPYTPAPLADYAPPPPVIDVRWPPEREAEPVVVYYESRASWHIIAAAWVTCGVACMVLVLVFLAYVAGLG